MSHTRPQLICLGAAVLALGVMLGTAVGAAGATAQGSSGSGALPTTLAGIKAKATGDITERVTSLNAAIGKVDAAKGLDASQATLVSYLGNDIAPLEQLDQTIQGDGTVQQASHDFGTIFRGYRVNRLVLPAAWIAADAENALLDASKASGQVATAALQKGRADVRQIVHDLKSTRAAAAAATTTTTTG